VGYDIVIKYEHVERTQTGQISFGGKNTLYWIIKADVIMHLYIYIQHYLYYFYKDKSTIFMEFGREIWN
jgi:hypothetical protein